MLSLKAPRRSASTSRRPSAHSSTKGSNKRRRLLRCMSPVVARRGRAIMSAHRSRLGGKAENIGSFRALPPLTLCAMHLFETPYWPVGGKPKAAKSSPAFIRRLVPPWTVTDAKMQRFIEGAAYLASTRVRASALRRSGPGSYGVRQRLCYLPPLDSLPSLPNRTTCRHGCNPAERHCRCHT
jgi:hypothetical protein